MALLPEILGEPVRALLAAPPAFDATGWRPLTLPFDSFEHACAIALSLCDLAEVLAPTALRASIHELAEQAMAVYGEVPSKGRL